MAVATPGPEIRHCGFFVELSCEKGSISIQY